MGGAIYGTALSQFNLTGGTFESNTAAVSGGIASGNGLGGAIYLVLAANGTTLFDGVNFKNNQVGRNTTSVGGGGALTVAGGTGAAPVTIDIKNANFENNSVLNAQSTGGSGGAIYSSAVGNITIKDSLFSGNQAQFGSAIHSAGNNTVLTILGTNSMSSISADLFADTDGWATQFVENKSILTTNGSVYGGGAVYMGGNAASKLVIDSVLFKNNEFTSTIIGQPPTFGVGGSAIHIGNGSLDNKIQNSLFQGNKAQNIATAGESDIFGSTVFVRNKSTVSIENSKFLNNIGISQSDEPTEVSEVEAEGILYAYDGNINVSNSWFEGNRSENGPITSGLPNAQNFGIYGGSIFLQYLGSSSFANSTFTDNVLETTGNTYGGGVMTNFSGLLSISDSTFSNNLTTAQNAGASAVLNNFGYQGTTSLTVSNTVFDNNRLTAVKGGITGGIIGNGSLSGLASSGGAITLTGNTFTNNVLTADKDITGGVLSNLKGNMTVTETTFKDNSATSMNGSVLGGVIYQRNGAGLMTINGSLFENQGASLGGAVYQASTTGAGSITIGDSATKTTIFSKNKALGTTGAGGAIYNNGVLSVKADFTENTAALNGGALYNTGASADLQVQSGSVFTNNNALSGGAIYNNSSSASLLKNVIKDTLFEGNTANQGGAVYNAGVLSLRNVNFDGNSATTEGGAIYNAGTLYWAAQDNAISLKTATDSIYSTGSLYFNTVQNMHLNADIVGANTANLYLNRIVGGFGTSGSILLDSTLKGFNSVYLDEGVLKIEKNGQLGTTDSPINLTLSKNAQIDVNNGVSSRIYVKNLTLNNTILDYPAISTNLDLSGGGVLGNSDQINVAGNQTGVLYYNSFTLLNAVDYTVPMSFQLMTGTGINQNGIKMVAGYVDTGSERFKLVQNPDNKGNEWVQLVRTGSPYADPLRAAIYLTYNDTLGARDPAYYKGESATMAFAIDGSGKMINYYANAYTPTPNNVADMPINPATTISAPDDYLSLTISGYTQADYVGGSKDSTLDAGVYDGADKISGTKLGGLALLTNNSVLTIENVTIQNASFFNGATNNNINDNNGSAIYNNGKLDTNNVLFTQNSSVNGGAIYNQNNVNSINGTDLPMNVRLVDTNFTLNTASKDGGAFYNDNQSGTHVELKNILFSQNTAENGGAIYNKGSMDITSGQFTDNSATGLGAAIYNSGTISLTNSAFNFTTAGDKGSATIYNTGTLFITALDDNTVFTGNTSGAIETTSDIYLNAGEKDSITFDNKIIATGMTADLFINKAVDTAPTNGTSVFKESVSGFNDINLQGGITQLLGNGSISTNNLSLDNAQLWLSGSLGSPVALKGLSMGNNSVLKINNGIQTTLNLKDTVLNNSTLDTMNGYVGDQITFDSLTAINAKINVDLDFNGAKSDTITLTSATGSLAFNDFTLFNEASYTAPTTFNLFDKLDLLTTTAPVSYSTVDNKYFIVDNDDGSLTFVLDSRPYKDPLLNAIYLTSTNLGITNKGDATYDMENDPFNPIVPTYNYTASTDISAHLISDSKSNKLTIDGTNTQGGSSYFIDGDKKYALLNVDTTGKLDLINVTLQNARADSTTTLLNGAAVYNRGTLTANGTSFLNNTSDTDGGAIYNTGTATIENALFQGNQSGVHGGAIHNTGTMALTDAVFTDNTAASLGQAIYNSGTLTMTDVDFNYTTVGDKGSATIYNSGTLSLEASAKDLVFEKNQSGAFDNTGTMTLTTDATRSMTFNDDIQNTNGTLNLSGNFDLNAFLNGGVVNMSSGQLILGSTAVSSGTVVVNQFNMDQDTLLKLNTANLTSLSLGDTVLQDNATFDLMNGQTKNSIHMTSLNATNGQVKLNIDFADETADVLTVSGNAVGNMTLSGIGILNENSYHSVDLTPTSVDKMVFDIMTGTNLSGLDLSTITAGVSHTGYNTSYTTTIDQSNQTVKKLVLENATTDYLTGQNDALNNATALANLYDKGWLLMVESNATSVANNIGLEGLLYVKGNNSAVLSGNGQTLFDVKNTGVLHVDNTVINNAKLINNGTLTLYKTKLDDVVLTQGSGQTTITDSQLNNTTLSQTNGSLDISAVTQNSILSNTTAMGDILLNGLNGHHIVLNQDIQGSGVLKTTGLIDLNGNASSYLGEVDLTNTTLQVAHTAGFFGGDLIVNNGSTLSLIDMATPWTARTLNMNKWTLNDNLTVAFNVDLVNKTSDVFGGIPLTKTGDEKINLKTINLLSNKRGTTDIQVANSQAKSFLTLDKQYTLLGDIFKYAVTYSDLTGILTFKTTDVNPGVVGSDSASQTIGVLGAIRTYNNAFNRVDKQGALWQKKDGQPYQNFWVEGSGDWDNIDLKNGPNVKGNMQNIMLGADGQQVALGQESAAYGSIYMGALRTEQKYEGTKLNGDGGYVGVMGTYLIGNFVNSVTVTGGYTNVDTTASKEGFDLYHTGIALKTAYHQPINERLTLTPSVQTGYTHVWSTAYTNYENVSIKKDNIGALQVIPALKLSAQLGQNWKPYTGVSYVYNHIFDGKPMAQDVILPDYQLRSYTEYKLGIEKKWAPNISAYAEGAIRQGGMTGGSVKRW